MQAWYYCLSKHRGTGSGSVNSSCLLAVWAVISLLYIIIYRENMVSNRVSDDAARQRNTQAPPIVKKGSIVCVSPRCDPT